MAGAVPVAKPIDRDEPKPQVPKTAFKPLPYEVSESILVHYKHIISCYILFYVNNTETSVRSEILQISV